MSAVNLAENAFVWKKLRNWLMKQRHVWDWGVENHVIGVYTN